MWKNEGICVIYYPRHLFSLIFLPNWEDKILWAWRENFPLHFLSLLFSLLNQTRENSIFHHIFLSFFSNLFVYTLTKQGLSVTVWFLFNEKEVWYRIKFLIHTLGSYKLMYFTHSIWHGPLSFTSVLSSFERLWCKGVLNYWLPRLLSNSHLFFTFIGRTFHGWAWSTQW